MIDLPCACGNNVQVELWHAGLDRECSGCGAKVAVPPLDVLKRLSGDLHPNLDDWQKLVVAIETGERPFDGPCVGCHDVHCRYVVPVRLSVLHERHVDDDSLVRLSPVSVELKLPGGEETWRNVVIPLRLCTSCYDDFRNSYRKGLLVQSIAVALVSVVAFGLFFYLSSWGGAAVAVVLVALCRIASRWKRKDHRFHAWLSRIPQAKNLLDRETEYRLRRQRTVDLESPRDV